MFITYSSNISWTMWNDMWNYVSFWKKMGHLDLNIMKQVFHVFLMRWGCLPWWVTGQKNRSVGSRGWRFRLKLFIKVHPKWIAWLHAAFSKAFPLLLEWDRKIDGSWSYQSLVTRFPVTVASSRTSGLPSPVPKSGTLSCGTAERANFFAARPADLQIQKQEAPANGSAYPPVNLQ